MKLNFRHILNGFAVYILIHVNMNSHDLGLYLLGSACTGLIPLEKRPFTTLLGLNCFALLICFLMQKPDSAIALAFGKVLSMPPWLIIILVFLCTALISSLTAYVIHLWTQRLKGSVYKLNSTH